MLKKIILPLILLFWITLLYWWTNGFSAFTIYSYTFQVQGELPRPTPDFSLINQFGKSMRSSDYRGRFILYNFMYLHCSSVCGLTFSEIIQIHKKLNQLGSNGLVFMSVSVDPVRDDVESLKQAWQRLGSLDDWFITSFPEKNRDQITEKLEEMGVWSYPNYLGDFNHSVYLFLVNPKGELVKIFSPDFNPTLLSEAILKEMQ